ncbi:MAG TPA: hypothetical protein VFI09_03295 [Solirubrobacterales bacterium]|nr:hypothetical protein [Solirubrobacterales bacterium]
MRSIICRHAAISILLGQVAIYSAAYLVSGRAGVHFLAIALLIGWIFWLVIVVEKMAASLRKTENCTEI